MDYREKFVIASLELHLFFARIMKEHSLFLEAAATPANPDITKQAEFFKQEFEKLLMRAVSVSDGIVGRRVLSSGEVVTEFTLTAESQTQRLTGVKINSEITRRERMLRAGENIRATPALTRQVSALNRTALRLLGGLISLKERILRDVLRCRMFTMNYPLLLEHIIREAKLYRSFVASLEGGADPDARFMRSAEVFWNQIMMEHAQFIRGLLDPTENELIEASDGFANSFNTLLARAREVSDKTIVRRESLQETLKFREFKTAGAQGITGCKIRSVILPLLADHVLREANHYIRILSE